MNDGWKRFATFAFLLVALLFVLLAALGSWDALGGLRGPEGGWSVRPVWLVASLGLGSLNLLGMAAMWTWLARRMGETLSYGEGVTAWVGANLGRYIPGKVWQLAGLAVYVRGRGGSSSIALVSALVFQIIVLVSGAAAALLTLRGQVSAAFGGSMLLPILVVIGLAFALHPAVISRGTAALARLLREEETDRALSERGHAPSGPHTWVIGAALLAAWWVYGLGLWCLVAGISEEPVGDVWTLTGAFAASYVAGYMALVTPGGLIVREAAMTVLLAAVTPLTAAAAAVIAVLARLWTILSELSAFGIATLLRGSVGRARKGATTERDGG